MRCIQILNHASDKLFFSEGDWDTRYLRKDRDNLIDLGMCGMELDVIVSNVYIEAHFIKYMLTRLRNPRNISGGKDFPDVYFCIWREYNNRFVRLGTDVLQVSSDNFHTTFSEWLEDSLCTWEEIIKEKQK